ncbi:MAG: SH3 domain-containing protein [Novosphingobium sp.]
MVSNENLDGKSFMMRGPMHIVDPLHTPVRGDLADVRLAGSYFVPHYAVPQLRLIGTEGAKLLSAARIDADVVEELGHGSAFGVLDIAGEWAWGQADGESGPVGYVALAHLADLT